MYPFEQNSADPTVSNITIFGVIQIIRFQSSRAMAWLSRGLLLFLLFQSHQLPLENDLLLPLLFSSDPSLPSLFPSSSSSSYPFSFSDVILPHSKKVIIQFDIVWTNTWTTHKSPGPLGDPMGCATPDEHEGQKGKTKTKKAETVENTEKNCLLGHNRCMIV